MLQVITLTCSIFLLISLLEIIITLKKSMYSIFFTLIIISVSVESVKFVS